ncbi:MAG: hypothetical protein QXM92_01760 [Candidatus Anstonellales archaeon]
MDELKRRARLLSRLNSLAVAIRHEAEQKKKQSSSSSSSSNNNSTAGDLVEVDFVDVCIAVSMSPATLYSYVPFIERYFDDIIYKERKFYVALKDKGARAK